MPTDTIWSDTLYVHADPNSLPSFAEEGSFGNLVIGVIPLRKSVVCMHFSGGHLSLHSNFQNTQA